MSNTTMANKLPRKLEMKMQAVGDQIRLARLRRNLSVVQVTERATCSPYDHSKNRERCPDCIYWYLSPCSLCIAT